MRGFLLLGTDQKNFKDLQYFLLETKQKNQELMNMYQKNNTGLR